MKLLLLLPIILAVLFASTSIAFADHSEVTIETADNDLAAPGCLETEVGCYTPNTAVVDVGGVVTMTNTDETGIHTYTSGTVDGFTATPSEIFDSGILNAGNSYEWTADVEGEIPYYCTLHTWMQGLIIVQEVEDEDHDAEDKDHDTEDKDHEAELMVTIPLNTVHAQEVIGEIPDDPFDDEFKITTGAFWLLFYFYGIIIIAILVVVIMILKKFGKPNPFK